MNNLWIYQSRDYGLGNFINLTPTIKLMADHFGERIPVYFDLDFIEQCFLDCPFIEILSERPDNNPLFGSSLVNGRNDCPDYIHVAKEARKSIPLNGDLPHTYVDQANEIAKDKNIYTVFLRGSGSENLIYLSSKMPRDEYYQKYFLSDQMKRCAFTGSENDVTRAKGLFDGMVHHIGDIRKSLALIRDANLVVSNDTGLAHAAAAMNKNLVILWKNTRLPKNANPSTNCSYYMCH